MKWLLIVAGVIGLLIGCAMIFASGAFMKPMGLVLDDKLATLAQAQGGLLLALASINLMGRDLTGAAVRPILVGNITANVAGLGVNLRAALLHLVSDQVWGSVVMHVIFIGLFGFFLMRSMKIPAAT